MAEMIDVRPGVSLSFDNDWFGEPWIEPQAILMIHGVAESAMAWRQWVPHLALQYRVIRPDMAGHGRSPTPDDYSWSPGEVGGDLAALMDAIGLESFHVVGAKYGGSIAIQLAADFPDRVRSLALFGVPARGTGLSADLASVPDLIREIGVLGWAERTQPSRLGPDAPPEQLDWWTHELMAKTERRAALGATAAVGQMSVEPSLAAIRAPTLVVTTGDSPLQPIATVEAYQQAIRHSQLKVLDGDCYHIAAVRPEECAAIWQEFVGELDA